MQYRSWTEGKIAEFDLAVLKDDTHYPFRLQCEQYKLAGWLFEQLSTMSGVELLYSHEVTDFDQDDAGATLRAMSPSGPISITVRYAIGADGGRSTMRKLLDVGFEGHTFPDRILVMGTTLASEPCCPTLPSSITCPIPSTTDISCGYPTFGA